jgi:MerR family transcriptional regulator, thiopeptide resistance regulator
MERSYYQTGQFARKASVSARTLRYYDQVGLLSPSHYSESGYRLYTDEDYLRLQQILGLKYLGFSLEEIQRCLQNGPRQFKRALAVQKAMLKERKQHLESIIQTIEATEARLDHGVQDWESVAKIIEVIQMKEKKEWINKYFSEEQQQQMEDLRQDAYTDEDREKLAEWGNGWSEADQQEADRKWGELFAEAKRLADAGEDPAGEEAQALAKRWMGLVGEFTRNDPGITAGLQKFWKQMNELPADQRPVPKVLDDRQQAFVDQALSIYNQGQ